jgi:hypothetical protein
MIGGQTETSCESHSNASGQFLRNRLHRGPQSPKVHALKAASGFLFLGPPVYPAAGGDGPALHLPAFLLLQIPGSHSDVPGTTYVPRYEKNGATTGNARKRGGVRQLELGSGYCG